MEGVECSNFKAMGRVIAN